jgi:hypothetical protein
VRDELEQLLDDDDDMIDLFLSWKAIGAGFPAASVAASVAAPNWAPTSPTMGSGISWVNKASTIMSYAHGNCTGVDDAEDSETLLEVLVEYSISSFKVCLF